MWGGYQNINFQQSVGFFEEPKDSLDAVYIGASPTFTSWLAPLAWKKYGIAMRTFANNGQPFIASQYFLEIARKRQPNAVYLIAINGLYSADDLSVNALHQTTDYFAPSLKKIQLIDSLSNASRCTIEEQCELFFPIIRYHSRWNSLNYYSFHRTFEKYKGGFDDKMFFNITDISPLYF